MADTIDTSKINIDSTFSMAQSQTPSEDHSLFAFKIGSDGKPEKGTQGWYTIKALIAALGKVATDAEAGAIDAKEAAELALADCEAALTAIGQDDSSGARGQAITAISTALFNALASIGQSDTAGARGDAIAAIAAKLAASLQEWSTSIAADKTEVAGYKTAAETAKTDAETARDQAQEILEDVQAAANVSDASETTKGIMKLFGATGTATDGTMTQKSISEAIEAAKTAVMGNFELTASSYAAAVTA